MRFLMTKYKRNDPCPCGSGNKFKKCCERTLIGKKFRATKIETNQSPSSISSFFQKKIVEMPKVSENKVTPTKDETEDKKENVESDKKEDAK
jgi:hypothetical protein